MNNFLVFFSSFESGIEIRLHLIGNSQQKKLVWDTGKKDVIFSDNMFLVHAVLLVLNKMLLLV